MAAQKGAGRRAFAMTSGAGVPSMSVMSSSWCTTLRPGNSGLPSRISAKMQPMDQMSMAGEYFAKNDPHSSGARYHLRRGVRREGLAAGSAGQERTRQQRVLTAWRRSRSRRLWSACR